MIRELAALLEGRVIGTVRRTENGSLTFAYDESWRAAPGAYPLSFSMPLASAEHGHAAIEAFLWGLLPDNARVLTQWARRFQVSSSNPFALMAHVGEDCAGAVQFARPDRIDALLVAGASEVQWLSEADIAQRLRALRVDHAAWRSPRDTGQFSLAGAQPKTALFLENGRWGVPAGRTPTTHILKPPTGEFDGHAENEHLCMHLARSLDLTTARSKVIRFEDEIAIVIDRYDRRRSPEGIVRVHQEDMCQALAVLPVTKYENEGGPGAKAVIGVIRSFSSTPDVDVRRFVDALAFNWLIAGTDAHAKNYSMLIGTGGRARLAPLYDLASALPYSNLDPRRLKLAMKIGGRYDLMNIGLRQWQNLAVDLGLDPEEVVSRVTALAEALPDRIVAAAEEVKAEGLDHPLIERLVTTVTARTRRCARFLTLPAPSG